MIINNYKIIKKLGEGTSGTVYLGEKNNHQYAIKKINVKNFSKKEKKYLISEIIIQQKHNCKFIIKLFDLYYENHNIFIISEYASKGTLSQYILTHKNINIYLINKWLIQLSLGLRYLHNSNIIHRDLKCDNVFLDEYLNIKIGDLGIVKILFQKKFAFTNIGTPYFMSPELFKSSFYNYKTDIWSLGCILYQLITGKLPFTGRNIIQLSNNIQKKDFNRQFNHVLKKEYILILDKLLDKDYKTRCDLKFIFNHNFLKNYLSIEESTNNNTVMNLNIIVELEPINNWNMILNKVNSQKKSIGIHKSKNKNNNRNSIIPRDYKLQPIKHKPVIWKNPIPNVCENNKQLLKPLNLPPPIPERDYPKGTVFMETSFLLNDIIAKRNNKLNRLRNIKPKIKLKSVKISGINSLNYKKYKKKNHAKYIKLYKKNYISPYSKYNA